MSVFETKQTTVQGHFLVSRPLLRTNPRPLGPLWRDRIWDELSRNWPKMKYSPAAKCVTLKQVYVHHWKFLCPLFGPISNFWSNSWPKVARKKPRNPSGPFRTISGPLRRSQELSGPLLTSHNLSGPLRTTQDVSGPLRTSQKVLRTSQDFSGPLGYHSWPLKTIIEASGCPSQDSSEQLRKSQDLSDHSGEYKISQNVSGPLRTYLGQFRTS